MSTLSRRYLLLLLIGVDGSEAQKDLGGITRIQKLLYILEAEEGIRAGDTGFEFTPYKAGPYSPRVYDDLEFLENLDYICRTSSKNAPTNVGYNDVSNSDQIGSSAEASEAEKSELDFTFEQLMGPEDVMAPNPDEIAPTADSYEEARYSLTEKGKQKVEQFLADENYRPVVEGIRKVKSRFAKYSLSDLLYYVYSRHPEMTTESEIKEKVLRRRRV